MRNRNSFQGLKVEEETFEGCVLPNQGGLSTEYLASKWKYTKSPGPYLEGLDVCLETVSSEQRQSPLLQVQMYMQDTTVTALLDSGASYNFVNPKIIKDYGWKLEDIEPLAVHLADKTQVISKASCSTLATIGGLKVVQQFRVIDGAFLIVLGMPFLSEVYPRID